MSASTGPRPEHYGGRRPPDLPLAFIDQWARRAVERPWRYTTICAISVGVTNFGLRTQVNDLSVAHNARLAILTAAGFSAFAWLYTAQLTRPLRRPRLLSVAKPAVQTRSCAVRRHSRMYSHRPVAGRGPRFARLHPRPQRVEVPATDSRRPPAPSVVSRPGVVLIAVTVIAVAVAVLVAAVAS